MRDGLRGQGRGGSPRVWGGKDTRGGEAVAAAPRPAAAIPGHSSRPARTPGSGKQVKGSVCPLSTRPPDTRVCMHAHALRHVAASPFETRIRVWVG